MKVKAAVAHQAGAPLVIETVDLDGPKAGEVLVEIKATGVCHTDEFTRSGADRRYPSKLVNFLSASTGCVLRGFPRAISSGGRQAEYTPSFRLSTSR